MRNTTLVGTIALAAIVVGAVYLAADSADRSPAAIDPASARAEFAASPVDTQRTSDSQASAASPPMGGASNPAPTDPRLAALRVSPDNGFIEFVVGAGGKVIKEIDKDPTSLGFNKPLREYTYSGDAVIGLTSYAYFRDHVQITKTAVSYKPDGSVDEYLESTSYDHGKSAKST